MFINNTPQRVVATFGTYDRTDPLFAPDSRQFTLASDETLRDASSLDPGATSDIVSLSCARVFSVGGPDLVELIRRNGADADFDATALALGVEFFDPEVEGTLAKSFTEFQSIAAQARPASVGSAPPFEADLGIDFPCESLIIIRLEVRDAGSSRFGIDFELIPPESAR